MNMTGITFAEAQIWFAQTTRFTLFTVESGSLSTGLWSELTGKLPESSNSRPNEGILQEAGEFEGHKLVVTISPGRIDIVLVLDFPRHLDFNALQALNYLSSVVNPWLKKAPKSLRIALGGIWHIPVDNEIEGLKKLSSYLPSVKIAASNTTDFAYQINRPQPSKADNTLRINALNKWSVVQIIRAPVQVLPNGQLHIQGSQGLTQFVCNIETDVNTVPTEGLTIAADKLEILFVELTTVTKMLLAQGDRT